MQFIADFHIHSHYSRATSKQLIPEYLDFWARKKGIAVVGTGDFTHPAWLNELETKLHETNDGLFQLRNEYTRKDAKGKTKTHFLLTAEISNIYKKNDKVRKVHNLIFAPNFEIVRKIQKKLSDSGFNIISDGRPILGLDSKKLLEMLLEISEEIMLVPAHIWTPWFSALGSKSGFDSIKECFEEMEKYIFAVETGLSTDPPLNWMCSFLDKYTLLSNSDAHSPEKLGRNANIFDTDLSFHSIIDAIKTQKGFIGTIDMFPQEGKYHYDGHRKCGVCLNPVESLRHNSICPICNKKLTLGVVNRIATLADRHDLTTLSEKKPFYSIIPLKEILSEIYQKGVNTKTITQIYDKLTEKAETEFNLLLHYSIDEIKTIGGNILAEAISRMRNNLVFVKEGFDGEYGAIKAFAPNEIQTIAYENQLFKKKHQETQKRPLLDFDLAEYQRLKHLDTLKKEKARLEKEPPDPENKHRLYGLNPEQSKAVEHYEDPALIIAGPGTGKTRVLTYRIRHLIEKHKIKPENIIAITFTNKAAKEIKERLEKQIAGNAHFNVFTFHSFGFELIKEYYGQNFHIIDKDDKKWILKNKFNVQKKSLNKTIDAIAAVKQNDADTQKTNDNKLPEIFENYNQYLAENKLLDFEDLLYKAVECLKNDDFCLEIQKRYNWILIDEYQDINKIQYTLIQNLVSFGKKNVFAIGDPNQAIYGFRGAKNEYIQQFQVDFENAKTYTLGKSYRCSDKILKASDNILQHKSASLLTGVHKGVKLVMAQQQSDKSEAEYIARTIEDMIGGLGFFSIDSNVSQGNKSQYVDSLSDFAVLCRTAAQMEILEEAFRNHRIPYQKVGESSFYKESDIKIIIDILKYYLFPENSHFYNKTKDYRDKMQGFSFNKSLSIAENLKILIESLETIIEIPAQKVEKLLSFSSQFSTVEGFVKGIGIGLPTDTYVSEQESVALMSIHASKGLEFNCVFIPACENGIIPLSLYKTQKIDIEEERRILYVGMTRAKKQLFLTYAKNRFIRGKRYQQQRSVFIESIEKELIDNKKMEYKKQKPKDTQLKLF